jgi:ribonuclease J
MADRKTQRRTDRGGSEFVMVALGGLGEIGMNCYAYGIGQPDDRKWLAVDLGITFPEGEDDPGVDVILPDVRFLAENSAGLVGIVLTHAHEDHIGAVVELWPRLKAPVYATPFAAALLKAKMAEYPGEARVKIIEVAIDSRFDVGPFKCEFISVAHSIPESQALVLRTDKGTVFHTGDWKFDDAPYVGKPTDRARLEALGTEGVDCMVCDSTNALRDGRSPSETDVAASLANVIARSKGRVAMTIFSSNVARILAAGLAAKAARRKLVVAGRAMHRMIEVAIETGHLPRNFFYLDQEAFSSLAPDETLVLCTGSQGEPRAALARIADNQHPHVKLGKGDTVIFSSRTIPGNEREVGRIQNQLVELGCDLIVDGGPDLIHVTGHPRRDELKEMFSLIRPKAMIPMHGEARHLRANADLARQSGIADVKIIRNGDIVRVASGSLHIIDEAPVGRFFRDGNLIVPSDEGPVRERRKLAVVGIAVVSLVVGRRGELVADPDVVLDGIPYADEKGESMEDVALDAVDGTLRSIPPKRRSDTDMLADAVRRSVRAAIDRAWGKKPIVKVMVAQVDGR